MMICLEYCVHKTALTRISDDCVLNWSTFVDYIFEESDSSPGTLEASDHSPQIYNRHMYCYCVQNHPIYLSMPFCEETKAVLGNIHNIPYRSSSKSFEFNTVAPGTHRPRKMSKPRQPNICLSHAGWSISADIFFKEGEYRRFWMFRQLPFSADYDSRIIIVCIRISHSRSQSHAVTTIFNLHFFTYIYVTGQ